MLNPKSLKNIDPQKEATVLKTWLAIVIVVVVAILAGTVILKVSHNKKNDALPLTETQSKKNLKTEVHSYSGTIIKINNDNLVINASAIKNYLTKDTELTVNFNEQTQFMTLTIPQQLSGSPIKDQIKKETTDKKALKVGQNIFVTSLENIINQTNFIANKIEIQIIK
ncbi:MAG TPA: hypothetical protein PLK76_00080 [bacterium]|nr:hypothetical protein [bacterium]